MNFKGSASIVELPVSRNWGKNGWSITRKFKGTPTAISAKINELIYDGCQITHDPPETGGWETITCLYAWDPSDPQSQNPELPITDRWSLAGNQLEKKLWEMPKVVKELNKVTGAFYYPDFSISMEVLVDSGFNLGGETTRAQATAFLRKYVEALVNAQFSIENPVTGKPYVVTESKLMAALESYRMDKAVFSGLIKAMVKGVEAYSVSQYVLRRLTTIGPFCNIRPNYANVGKIYTSAILKSVEEIPETARIVLPEGVWLKQTPTLEQVDAGKWQISQEWWHADLYDPFIYEEAR